MKLGAYEGGESQLSFALLFMPIRALSDKKNYPKSSLYVGGRDIQPTSIDHHTLNSARIGTKLGAIAWGECQLSFALLFMSIRAFSDKKNYFNFSLYVGGAGHPTCRAGLSMPMAAMVL